MSSSSRKRSSKKPVAVAVGSALAGGLILSGSAFAMTPLAQGYALAAQETATAAEQHKAHEGRCGVAHMDSDGDGRISQQEFLAAHPDQTDKFAAIDTDGDGYIDQAEYEAHRAAKGAEGQCGAKEATEGKCGEGKCGEGMCGGS